MIFLCRHSYYFLLDIGPGSDDISVMQTFETRIVLKYPSPPEANQPNRVFVAIDYLSGGYPYAVPIGKAHEFYDYEAASKYRDAVASRGTFELCVVTITYNLEKL